MLVIFDVDGTLVDSQDMIVAAQRMTFAANGLAPPSRETSLSIVGLSLTEAFSVLAGPDGPVEALVEGYRQAFRVLRADPAYHEPLFAGAADLLAWLGGRGDVTLGIATGKSRRGVSHLIERHGWGGLFATIQTADDAPSKPHPGMIQNALGATGIAAGEAVMIGDSSYDMAMARAAGIGVVGVAWGYHPVDRLVEAGAETIVRDFGDLRRHLELDLLLATPA